ncbi:MAG: GrpB family protein [Marinibacterium sp.]|nr:GrpB family protein [Marinibacterium sp.]
MTVSLCPHDPAWVLAFDREARAIALALAPWPIRLHHIGSTSVAGCIAKPIIDLLGTVGDLDRFDAVSDAISGLGYEAMGALGIEGRRYFRKFDLDGARSHHLHVFTAGSPHVARHLAFRDYLRAHPKVVAAYGRLKTDLIASGAGAWEAYIDGKAGFVAATEADALRWSATREQARAPTED